MKNRTRKTSPKKITCEEFYQLTILLCIFSRLLFACFFKLVLVWTTKYPTKRGAVRGRIPARIKPIFPIFQHKLNSLISLVTFLKHFPALPALFFHPDPTSPLPSRTNTEMKATAGDDYGLSGLLRVLFFSSDPFFHWGPLYDLIQSSRFFLLIAHHGGCAGPFTMILTSFFFFSMDFPRSTLQSDR